ncbi:MAG: hypothetical protein AB4426_15840 [Xenococcaceae cyanobacterium]
MDYGIDMLKTSWWGDRDRENEDRSCPGDRDRENKDRSYPGDRDRASSGEQSEKVG